MPHSSRSLGEIVSTLTRTEFDAQNEETDPLDSPPVGYVVPHRRDLLAPPFRPGQADRRSASRRRRRRSHESMSRLSAVERASPAKSCPSGGHERLGDVSRRLLSLTPLPAKLKRAAPLPVSHPYLQELEAESIHIMREVAAEFRNPVMLYSIGKDSSVMLHLALKAFYPAKPPFPLLHVDTTWKFREMIAFRDRRQKARPRSASSTSTRRAGAWASTRSRMVGASTPR